MTSLTCSQNDFCDQVTKHVPGTRLHERIHKSLRPKNFVTQYTNFNVKLVLTSTNMPIDTY